MFIPTVHPTVSSPGIFPSPFAPQPATIEEVAFVAALTAGWFERDPATGELRMTPTGEQQASVLFPPPVSLVMPGR